ncbi:MAG: hypothetical protein GQ569_00215 [Methylococcaceae bacterium]|nr:hypothetical protein [Methylococcaceae bacterium]
MKKLLLISLSALLLSACADKDQYKEAVLAQMKTEQDIKDYKISPEEFTDCVVDLTSKNMPGVVPFDPDRLMAYRNYATMLTIADSKDPQKTFTQLKKDFGTAKALSEAKINYSESVGECLTGLISRGEAIEKEAAEEAKGG